jgi:hypothetical protein
MDRYLDQQLANPAVHQAYEEESELLLIGMQPAKQRSGLMSFIQETFI